MKTLHNTVFVIFLFLIHTECISCLLEGGYEEQRDEASVGSHQDEGANNQQQIGKDVPQLKLSGETSNDDDSPDDQSPSKMPPAPPENKADDIPVKVNPPLEPVTPKSLVTERQEPDVSTDSERPRQGIQDRSCEGKDGNGVPCDEGQKVASPDIPELSQPLQGSAQDEPDVKREISPDQIQHSSDHHQQQEKEQDTQKPEQDQDQLTTEQTVVDSSEDKKAMSDEGDTTTGPAAPPTAATQRDEIKNKSVKENETVTEDTSKGEEKTDIDTDPKSAESVTPPIHVIVPEHGEEDMPSFNEWKKKQKEVEAEEEEKIKSNGASSQPGSISQKTRPSTMRTNFASLSCGAKVLAYNPEVQHASYILSDSKDEYMINPCSANKWFIVELCEPVQVKFIELANYELFSSLPKDVRFHVSDKYSTKDWKLLDTFTANDERKIQIFPIAGQQLYSKYMKVEVLSFFGSEHFCTLSSLRVFGTSFAEIDDDDHDSGDHVEEAPSDVGASDGGSNIFESATKMVMKVVQKVLTGADESEKALSAVPAVHDGEVENKTDLKPCSNREFHPSGDDQDGNATGDYTVPCLPESSDPGMLSPRMKPSVPYPSEVLSTQQSVLSPLVQPAVPYPTISQPNLSQNDAYVTVARYFGAFVGATYNLMLNCYICETAQSKFRTFSPLVGHGSCVYVWLMLKGWQISNCCCRNCSDREQKIIPVNEQTEMKTPESLVETSTKMVTLHPTLVVGDVQSNHDEDFTSPTSVSIMNGGTSSAAHIPITTSNSLSEVTAIHPSQNSKLEADKLLTVYGDSLTPDVTKPSTAQASKLHIKIHATSTVSDSTLLQKSYTSTVASESAAATMGPKVIHASDTQTEASQSPAEPLSSAAITEEGSKEEERKESGTTKDTEIELKTEALTPPAEVTESQTTAGVKEEPTDSPPQSVKPENGGNKPDNGGQDAIMQEPPVGGAASAGKRDSAIARLNNRVKALELNMSLSSRYLEELSLRYKKQMETMYRSFNLTIDRLKNTSKWAEERDQRQKEKIGKLQTRIDDLSQTVDNLTKHMDRMHVKSLEYHLFFLVVETMVMFILFLMCTRRNRQRTTSAELHEILQRIPDHRKLLTRHNSDTALNKVVMTTAASKSRSLGDMDRKLAGSDSSLFIVEPSSPFLTDNKELSEFKKKKRKKTKHRLQGIHSTHVMSGNQLKRSPSSPAMTSAGLLFGSQSVQKNMCSESVNDVHTKPLRRSSSLSRVDVIFENSSSSRTPSSNSNESFKFENMTSNEVVKKRGKKSSGKVSPENIGAQASAKGKYERRDQQPTDTLPGAAGAQRPKKSGKKYYDDYHDNRYLNGSSGRMVNGGHVEQKIPKPPPLPVIWNQKRDKPKISDHTETYSDSGRYRRLDDYDPLIYDTFETFSDGGRHTAPKSYDGMDFLGKVKKKKSEVGGMNSMYGKKKSYDYRHSQDGGSSLGWGRRGSYRGKRY